METWLNFVVPFWACTLVGGSVPYEAAMRAAKTRETVTELGFSSLAWATANFAIQLGMADLDPKP